MDNPLSLNRYTYVHNNPLRYVDPTGHAAEIGGKTEKFQLLEFDTLDPAIKDMYIDRYLKYGEQAIPKEIRIDVKVWADMRDFGPGGAGIRIVKAGKAVISAINGAKTASQLSRESVQDKLYRYLLNTEHEIGGSKAKWFSEALGFSRTNLDDLAKQIVFDPKKAVQTGVTEHGIKYNQLITIEGANGRVIDVTFAWIKNNDGVVRLVTAIPTKK